VGVDHGGRSESFPARPMNTERNAPSHPKLNADWVDGAKQGVLLGVALAALMLPPGSPVSSLMRTHAGQEWSAAQLRSTHAALVRKAHIGAVEASADVRRLANWVVASGDNRQQFFVLVDKKNTRVFVFNADGTLRGATPVLIGAAIGDDSMAGIGSRPIALVEPHERTTPAGRFEGERGRNANGEDVVWVDYDAAVSMHRVRAHEPKERRLERLASPQTDDNRISYGCINVPVDFYEAMLQPAFAASRGVVYVLPEIKALDEVFTALPRGADEVQVTAQ
jgi:hypothetical protein